MLANNIAILAHEPSPSKHINYQHPGSTTITILGHEPSWFTVHRYVTPMFPASLCRHCQAEQLSTRHFPSRVVTSHPAVWRNSRRNPRYGDVQISEIVPAASPLPLVQSRTSQYFYFENVEKVRSDSINVVQVYPFFFQSNQQPTPLNYLGVS